MSLRGRSPKQSLYMNNNIIIKNIDQTILERLKFEAKKQKTDLNSLILSIIKKFIGSENKYYDLDHLAGTWSKEDYDTFITNTSGFNQIDEQL